MTTTPASPAAAATKRGTRRKHTGRPGNGGKYDHAPGGRSTAGLDAGADTLVAPSPEAILVDLLAHAETDAAAATEHLPETIRDFYRTQAHARSTQAYAHAERHQVGGLSLRSWASPEHARDLSAGAAWSATFGSPIDHVPADLVEYRATPNGLGAYAMRPAAVREQVSANRSRVRALAQSAGSLSEPALTYWFARSYPALDRDVLAQAAADATYLHRASVSAGDATTTSDPAPLTFDDLRDLASVTQQVEDPEHLAASDEAVYEEAISLALEAGAIDQEDAETLAEDYESFATGHGEPAITDQIDAARASLARRQFDNLADALWVLNEMRSRRLGHSPRSGRRPV